MGKESDTPDDTVLLHGDLDLRIIQARRLPNMDMVTEHLRRCFVPCRTAIDAARNSRRRKHQPQHHRHKIVTSDPYVKVCLSGATVARTRICPNSQDPIWDESFSIALAHPARWIEFHVKDNDVFGAQLIGVAKLPAADVRRGESIEGWLPVIGSSGAPPKPETAIYVSLQFTPFEANSLYKQGIARDPGQMGVRGTYFSRRKGGHLRLYQDAHVPDGMLPEIALERGKVFQHEKCWEDICHAILEAHHLIYIVGWSVYHKVKLVREPTKPLPQDLMNMTLGDLLKYKSQEGVRVCLLVWDDKTSHNKFMISTEGVMHTHDEETRKFFKHSSVICVLSPRYGSSKHSIVKQRVVGTLFTHHQKCVLVDTQAYGNNRKITAFVGGLDLCDGRYDTPEHRLYRDLDTVFQNDYHNPTFPTEGKGPRQPWHDLHCRIDGPAAYDVLKNFEQRWRKATRWWVFGRGFRRERRWHDDALIHLERISWILSPKPHISEDDPQLFVSSETDSETWHVQIFRSIDSGSVKGFPKIPSEAISQNLVCEKNVVIDRSIHTAYVQAIRSAQHFIYIENQYFLGSSYAWPSHRDAGADNLVPMELALKIASKIRANERFAVYVVIPLWPEGVPSDAAVQEILFWQNRTMQMMYDIVAREIKSMDLKSHPCEYLNFYCLAKREEPPQEMNRTANQLSQNTDVVAPKKKVSRFMIYVHAKGMIVDDEYVLLGSANINQRSLDGSRDTEIAMGAYQPHYTWNEKREKPPHGQVYGYRMSLWTEHLGTSDERFKEPHRKDCVMAVNEIADENWKRFIADDFRTLQGHLLRYPVAVEADGKVCPLPNCENFPDFGGKICGADTNLPNALTT